MASRIAQARQARQAARSAAAGDAATRKVRAVEAPLCLKCGKPVTSGQLCATAARRHVLHEECLQCTTCNSPLSTEDLEVVSEYGVLGIYCGGCAIAVRRRALPDVRGQSVEQ